MGEPPQGWMSGLDVVSAAPPGRVSYALHDQSFGPYRFHHHVYLLSSCFEAYHCTFFLPSKGQQTTHIYLEQIE